MVWSVFTNTVAGPGFLAGDYVGASGQAALGAGLEANVLLGGSNRTVTRQPIPLGGQTGLNLANGVAALHLGLDGRVAMRAFTATGRRWVAVDDRRNEICAIKSLAAPSEKPK
jgi:Protein of unknown function (DUF992)